MKLLIKNAGKEKLMVLGERMGRGGVYLNYVVWEGLSER